jgi:hypothetical protein
MTLRPGIKVEVQAAQAKAESTRSEAQTPKSKAQSLPLATH